jgi:hypothetical protein
MQQGVAGRGQFHAACAPHEQGSADSLFEFEQALARRRYRDRLARRSARQRALFEYREKELQGRQV